MLHGGRRLGPRFVQNGFWERSFRQFVQVIHPSLHPELSVLLRQLPMSQNKSFNEFPNASDRLTSFGRVFARQKSANLRLNNNNVQLGLLVQTSLALASPHGNQHRHEFIFPFLKSVLDGENCLRQAHKNFRLAQRIGTSGDVQMLQQ